MKKLSAAKSRTLSYMRNTGAQLNVGDWGTGWIDDEYQWPVSGQTVNALHRSGLIERFPSNRAAWAYRITDAGLRAIQEGE